MKKISSFFLLLALYSAILSSNETVPENLGFDSVQEAENLEYWKKLVGSKDVSAPPPGISWDMWKHVKTFNEYEGKLILSYIRQGDYTHVGEEEAIDIIMSRFTENGNRTILDVACGLGGTANYIQGHGWGKVTGFDIDDQTIKYAKTTYPEIDFVLADVANASQALKGRTFDLICIVNSIVCFPDQVGALKQLRTLAKKNTKLLIFEYTDLAPKGKNPLVGSARISFKPIRYDELKDMLDESGWDCEDTVILDAAFEKWYANFLVRLEEKKEEVDKRYGKGASDYTKGKYSLLYHNLKNKNLGGCLLVLKPKN